MWHNIPLPLSLNRAVHVTLSAAMTVLAIPIAWHFWKWSGLAIPFLWGTVIVLSMRSGMERAPPEACERKESRGVSIGVKMCFFLIVFAPAMVPLVFADLVGAFAWTWIIVLGFSVSDLVYGRFRGRIAGRSRRRGYSHGDSEGKL